MNSVSKTGGGLELWRGKHSFAKGRLVKSPWKKIDIQSELQKKYVDITEYDKYAILLKACDWQLVGLNHDHYPYLLQD